MADPTRSIAPDVDAPKPGPGTSAAVDLARIVVCPYLISSDGSWRSATAVRDHRCWAVAPPAQLATEKQRRLCLTPEHVGCATFEAAQATRVAAHDRDPGRTRPVARTIPVVLDHGRLAALPALTMDRRSGQTVLIGLLAVAFAALILGRLTGAAVPGASDAPSSTSSAPPSLGASAPVATPVPTAHPGASSSVGPVASDPAASTPPVTGSRTYKVKAGDTLVGIAAKFETTPKKIRKLNGLTARSTLKVGQVLQIP